MRVYTGVGSRVAGTHPLVSYAGHRAKAHAHAGPYQHLLDTHIGKVIGRGRNAQLSQPASSARSRCAKAPLMSRYSRHRGWRGLIDRIRPARARLSVRCVRVVLEVKIGDAVEPEVEVVVCEWRRVDGMEPALRKRTLSCEKGQVSDVEGAEERERALGCGFGEPDPGRGGSVVLPPRISW
ncbi:hypothetical protein BOTBODRAFT_44243 [Botryobasidium botryosum FD-172 SS1]|uniref:Uncharacterized protein n=1 Tax=Botryobasidium botryosum (strain FD-172 SS1) TaxID=930990 RepID=A0A067MTU2_BOTB1|nr:hypothetical protein BOTBODRAFT_44243 [Botryobasidium botryosum FD-172 SS1]